MTDEQKIKAVEILKNTVKELRDKKLTCAPLRHSVAEAYRFAGLSAGNIDDVLINEGIETMRYALSSSENVGDIYVGLFHLTKKIAQCKFSDCNNEAVRDFFKTMLTIGRSAGDYWVIIDAQRNLKGDEFASRLEKRIDRANKKGKERGEELSLFYRTVLVRERDKKRREIATQVVRSFLEKYENFPFDPEAYRSDQISQIERYLGGSK